METSPIPEGCPEWAVDTVTFSQNCFILLTKMKYSTFPSVVKKGR
jgi:hypothetical protein